MVKLLLPSASVHDRCDCRSINKRIEAGNCSYCHTFSMKTADLMNIVPAELCSTVVLSGRMYRAPFRLHIADVPQLIRKFEMVWIYTRWVVAVMANIVFSRVFSFEQKPCRTVCEPATSSQPKNPIPAALLFGAGPVPTSRRSYDYALHKRSLCPFNRKVSVLSPAHGALYIYGEP